MSDPERLEPRAAGAAPHEDPDAGFGPEEEPLTTGTLFVMIVFLMALAGMWLLMYLMLLGR